MLQKEKYFINKCEFNIFSILIQFIITKQQAKDQQSSGKNQQKMHQYGSSQDSDISGSSFHSDFSPSMISDQAKPKQSQPMISFKYHPGFMCFFQDYVNRQGWTFHQCYDKVFKSHHQMQKIRNPTQKLIKDPKLDKNQKITQLMHRAQKDKIFALYVKKPDGQLQCNLITHQDRKIQQINKLQAQLDKLEIIKARVIQEKKKQFQQKQIQKSKEQERQIQNLMTEKERRADYVKKVQMEAEEKRRIKRKLQQEQQKNKSDAIQSSGQSQCQIM